MSNIGVGFKVDRSGLSRGLKHSRRSISRFAKDASTNINNKLVGGLKSIPSALGIGVGVAGVVMATRKLAQYESQLTRLAIQGNLTKKEQMDLSEQISQVAMATGQSRSEILNGLNAVVQRTGDIDQAKNIMGDLAKASQATGAGMSDLGATASLLKRDFGMLDKDASKFFDLFTAQGKMGAFTLEDMASQTEKLFATAGRFDMTGIQGAKEIGALAQVARMATSSAEEAATAVKATFSDVIKSRSKIEKMGISFKNEDGSQKSMTDILKEIVTATKGDKQQQKLQKIFNERSIPLITKLSSGLTKDGNFKVLDQFMLQEKDYLGTIEKDNDRYMQTASAQMGRIGALFEIIADKTLSGTLEKMADSIETITKDPKKMEELVQTAEMFGKVVTGITELLAKSASGWAKLFSLYDESLKIMADASERNETAKVQQDIEFGKTGLSEKQKRRWLERRQVELSEAFYDLPEHVRSSAIATNQDLSILKSTTEGGRGEFALKGAVNATNLYNTPAVQEAMASAIESYWTSNVGQRQIAKQTGSGDTPELQIGTLIIYEDGTISVDGKATGQLTYERTK